MTLFNLGPQFPLSLSNVNTWNVTKWEIKLINIHLKAEPWMHILVLFPSLRLTIDWCGCRLQCRVSVLPLRARTLTLWRTSPCQHVSCPEALMSQTSAKWNKPCITVMTMLLHITPEVTMTPNSLRLQSLFLFLSCDDRTLTSRKLCVFMWAANK